MESLNNLAPLPDPEATFAAHREDLTAAEWTDHLAECEPCATWELYRANTFLDYQIAKGLEVNGGNIEMAERRLAQAEARVLAILKKAIL